MKKTLFIIFAIFIFQLNAQDILMQNGTFNVSSGTFLDSGGSTSNYTNNENYIITICPDQVSDKIELNFTEFSTQANTDIMTIYDGDSTASSLLGTFSGGGTASNPGLISAAFGVNPSGCITIAFVSNGLGTSIGWSADISIYTPCQGIISQIDSAIPAINSDGYIQVCTGDNITLNGSGVFETDGTGATYEWDLGNENTIPGQTVTFSYNTPGVYFVNLMIRDTNTDPNPIGCGNTNFINQIIHVSVEPDFTGTEAADSILCFGEATSLTGIVNSQPIIYNCPPPISQETFLPDGNGVLYSTCVTVDCFADTDVITDVSQILDICLNIEHSYTGDIDIKIISPSGQEVVLFEQGGGGTYLGNANNDDSNDPGVGVDYCFSMSATTLLVNAPTIIAGSNPPSNSYVPSTYLPVETFDALLGSPLNGDWCIIIVDNIPVDNGYIFSWELNFDPSVPMQDFAFTPVITSESWDSDVTITQVNGNEITVAPPTSGEFCYTYRVLNDIGCEYTKEVCINVADENQVAITYYEDADGDGFGDENGNTIIVCSNTPPEGYVANKLDCDDGNSLINPAAVDTLGNGIDENCDGTDGILSVEDFKIDTVSISPNPFTNKITISLSSRLDGIDLNVEIYDINGRLVHAKLAKSLNSKITINSMDRYEKGTYFLKLSNKEEALLVVKKIIKI